MRVMLRKKGYKEKVAILLKVDYKSFCGIILCGQKLFREKESGILGGRR